MNRLAWDKSWKNDLPWSAWLWSLEDMAKWKMDDISDINAIKEAYRLVHQRGDLFPSEAYRMFLPDSKCRTVGGDAWAIRFALAPKGCPANHVFPSPFVHNWYNKDYTPDMPF
jgi:hypothetical protein